MHKKLFNAALILAIVCPLLMLESVVKADDEPLYKKIKFEPIWKAKDLPLKIKWQEEKEINLPAIVRKKNRRIVLRLQARINAEKNWGWNNYLSIWVNGQPVNAADRSGTVRLLNRSETFKTAEYGTRIYMNKNSLLLFFAPDFDSLAAKLPEEVHRENFWYLIDITDLVDDIDMNILKLKCTTLATYFKGQEIGWTFIGDCEVGYIETQVKNADFKKIPLVSGETLKMKNYSIVLTKGNGFEIKTAGEQYFVESSFSYPEAGFNKFIYDSTVPRNMEKGWKVQAERSNKGFKLTAGGKYYTLTRLIEALDDRIDVKDEITNLSDAPLGIVVNNCLFSNSLPEEVFTDSSPGNPTVFMGQKQSGLGIVVNDDIYRLQIQTEYNDYKINFFTKNFGLRAKSSYTLQWAIYPRCESPAERAFPLTDSERPDYWDFINQVRRNWKVNFQVNGPWEGIHTRSRFWDNPYQRKIYVNQKVRYLSIRPWLDFQEMISVNRKAFAENWHKAADAIRKITPDVKLLVPVETTFSLPMPVDKIQESPLHDSFARDEAGKPIIVSQWYPVRENEQWKHGAKNIRRYLRMEGYEHVHVSLEKGKGALKEFKEQCDFIFNDLKADGVYLDLFGHGSTRRPGYRYSYDRWDGHTVDIDPEKFTVTGKYTDLALVSSSGQAEVIGEILAEGKSVVANYPPATREMTNVHIDRFTEVSGNLLYCYCTHLYSPVGLGTPWRTTSGSTTKALMEDVIDYLNSGVLYYFYGIKNIDKPENLGVVSRCFPFTPVELHSGWLVGEERIITAKSGTFGWHDLSRVKGYLFDCDGTELPFTFKTEQIENELVTKVNLKPGQIAILERIAPLHNK